MHLLLLDESPAHHVDDCRFNEDRRDRLPLPGGLTMTGDGGLIVPEIRLDVLDARRQILGQPYVAPNELKVWGEPLR